MQKPKIFFLIGPTAVGKTETAIHLAKKLNAEIISCDSMQIYKDMDIITSKPSKALRKKVRHHLVDVLPVGKEYNVSRYRKGAVKIIKQLIKKDKTPLFVVGTGLYMSILIDGIFEAKAQDNALRKKLYKQAKLKGRNYLYNGLKKVDPEAAAKTHPNDTKRLIRALEVFKITGKPISELQKLRRGLSENYDIIVIGLDMNRENLYRRIDERVDKMFKKGLAFEVKRLLKLKLGKTASCAIGIKELKGYFDGEYDLEEVKRKIKQSTRNYAKRQLTWFRKDKRIRWINVGEKDKPTLIANRILKLWKKHCW